LEDKILRKKSHIALAKYIVEDMEMPEMSAHRKAFYLGSILPDCKPSFLTQRHEFELTFDRVKKQIEKLTQGPDVLYRNTRAFMRHLGEVIHYLADYFTFPHNSIYGGTLREHCSYEKELKFRLKEYVESGETFRECTTDAGRFSTVGAVFDFIQNVHDEYLSMRRNVEEDCKYIVWVCRQVVHAILNLILFQNYVPCCD